MNILDSLSNIPQIHSNYTQKLDIALLGAGKSAYYHVHSLLRFSSFNLKYIIDPNLDQAKSLQSLYGGNIIVSDSIDIMLEDESIKAVIVTSELNQQHCLTKKCLEANKNVLVEKPLNNYQECFKIAINKNLKLLVAYHKRFDLNYQQIIQKIKNKNYNIRNIKVTIKDNSTSPIHSTDISPDLVLDLLTYDLDIINLLMNFEIPTDVVAFSNNTSDLLDLDMEILMKYKNGELVTLTASRNSKYTYDQRIEVTGDFGHIQLNNEPANLLSHFTVNGKQENYIKNTFPDRFKEAYLNELNYFYHMIVNDYLCIITPEHIETNYIISDLIHKSLQQSNVVRESNTLRTYKLDTPQYKFYLEQHTIQTLEYVEEKLEKYSNLGRCKMTIHQALEMLDDFVDPSDPDVDLPNSIHAYQTAERIRKSRPLQEQLQLTGLIHDLGKVLFKFGEKSESVVGDTFVLGCPFPECIVYYDTLKNNPDWFNSKYNQGLGIYEEKCGLDNLKISFGHDEYLYLVLKNNTNHKLDRKYWNIIRYHSLYPWHTGKAYTEFMLDKDYETLEDVLDFNQFDLYSKEDTDFVLTQEIKEYYKRLIDKYFPEEITF